MKGHSIIHKYHDWSLGVRFSLMSYPRNSVGGFNSTAEMQSGYFNARADLAGDIRMSSHDLLSHQEPYQTSSQIIV